MIGIIDWRMAQCAAMDVEFRFNTFADIDNIRAENPDVVIIATGGLPDGVKLEGGDDLAVTAWDLIAGDVKPGKSVLVFDEAGDHAALQAAEVAAQAGSAVEIMTPDRTFSPEVMGMNLVPYMRSLQDRDATFTVAWRLVGIERDGNGLKAIIGSDYLPVRRERSYDQIVVNNGTVPFDDLYLDLKPLSANKGAVDYNALIAGREQPAHGEGFVLYRIGDAVSARNTHAAIYDALRLMKDV